MRVLGCRWGLVMAIIGFPILGRGIYAGDTLLLSMGSSLIAIGVSLWGCLRCHHNTNMPPQQTS
jgi:hypothetical protein